jgi:hypothetical protein
LKRIHGDLHFQNILIGKEPSDFLLADPRGDLEGLDIYYDLGKLWHSFNGKYDLIHTDISHTQVLEDKHSNYKLSFGPQYLLDTYSSIKITFENMMKNCWNIKDNRSPPPPSLVSFKSANQKILPRSKQAYGDIIEWNQEPTEKEINELQDTQKFSKKTSERQLHLSTFQLNDQASFKNEDLDKDRNIKFLSHTMSSENSVFSSYTSYDKPIIEKKNVQKSLEVALAEKKEKNDKRVKSLKEVLEEKYNN